MSKQKTDYESVKKYTDAELLDMWERGWSTEQLVKMLHREDKSISLKDARAQGHEWSG